MTAEEVLTKIKPGDIILTSARKFELPSAFIRIANFFKRGFNHRFWTHSAIYLGNEEIIEAFPTGVMFNNIRKSYLDRKDYKIKVVRLRNRPPAELQKIADNCRVIGKGEPYDFLALSYFVFSNILPPSLAFLLDDSAAGKSLNKADSYFCSELAATGLLKSNIYCFENEPHQVMPMDFDNELLFEPVAEKDMEEKGWVQKQPEWLKRLGYFVVLLIWLALIPVIIFLLLKFFKSKSGNKQVTSIDGNKSPESETSSRDDHQQNNASGALKSEEGEKNEKQSNRIPS